MDVYPQDLPKSLYLRALELDLESITLCFSGGDDEGFLSVYTQVSKENKWHEYLTDWAKREKLKGDKKALFEKFQSDVSSFEGDVEDWAWTVYEYSGCGDGTDYGDDIVYDLKKKAVVSSEWCMERKEGSKSKTKLQTVEDEV